jgi:xanthine dehydrogenase YagR molybdenum-binding subunit
MALEVAMDELAEKLGMDPVDLRILNDTQVDPENLARPFSQRRFVECLRSGAEKFGWSQRNARPRSGATGAGWWAWAWRGHSRRPYSQGWRASPPQP